MVTRREFNGGLVGGVGALFLNQLPASRHELWKQGIHPTAESWGVVAGREGEGKLPAITFFETVGGAAELYLVPDERVDCASTWCFGEKKDGMVQVPMHVGNRQREDLGMPKGFWREGHMELFVGGVRLTAWAWDGRRGPSIRRIHRTRFDDEITFINWGEKTDLG